MRKVRNNYSINNGTAFSRFSQASALRFVSQLISLRFVEITLLEHGVPLCL
jgi:lipoprotein signal peptidase